MARPTLLVLSAVGVGLAAIVVWVVVRANRPTIRVDAPPAAPSATALVERRDAAPVAVERSDVPAVVDDDDGGPMTCAEIKAKNRAAMASATAGRCAAQAMDPLGCVTTSQGVTWGYEIASATTKDDNSNPPDSGSWDAMNCTTTVDVALVRVGGGHRSKLPAQSFELSGFSWRGLEVRALADYDGDGEVEMLTELSGKDHEGGPVGKLRIVTYAKGAIAPYAPAAGLTIVEVKDADGDGRPDLVTRGPYEGIESESALGNSWPAGPAIFLEHATANGRFVLGDAVSIAFTRSHCPSLPPLTFAQNQMVTPSPGVQPNDQLSNEAIVCARLRGASEADVVKAWTAVCPASDGGVPQLGFDCQDWPKDLASETPPFQL